MRSSDYAKRRIMWITRLSTMSNAMGTQEEFIEYIRKTDRIEQYCRVVACCRILGLKCDEITIESVTQACKTQLVSPGVHSKLAKEMTAARNDIIKWIRKNPNWRQIPRL
jgi:hypothetical protein